MDLSSLLATIHDNLRGVGRLATPLDVATVIVVVWALRGALRVARRSFKTTKLRGPPRKDLIFGVAKQILESPDPGAMYDAWAKRYGVAYEVPMTLGGKQIVLTDPRALAHYYARETWIYVQTNSTKFFLQRNFGRGVVWSEGERKLLTPSFSPDAIRNVTHVFYSSAHKVKSAWEVVIDTTTGGSPVIEVEEWMNHISLDSIGLAGFSHDFGSLDGKPASITEVLDTFGSSSERPALTVRLLLLARVFPLLPYATKPRTRLFREMQTIMEDISSEWLARTRKEKEEGVLDGKEVKSVIEVLANASDPDSPLHLTHEEMKSILIAGYESTSITMTWALLELARNPDIQSKLREELLAFGEEPTYDQQQHSLPYLDAVVHETLRVHPAVTDLFRVAAEDDVIPLSEPVTTQSGKVVNSISVARGTQIGIPISCINRSTEIWGADAKVFRPERWLEEDGIPKKAQDIQAYRHLLTFVDGPKTCLGKNFAVAEFKAVMSVLVKDFVFELRDGPNTQVEFGRGMILPRPKIVGEQGTSVPLRVRRYEG
ncbi:cytochrome P450 [Pisolithus thermaeus]|nr:cytochrome P450 [Pisolithus croceorrhizus]KAI6159218.1 cytochrome P450 [Pisolithus thermaeus]